LHAVLLEGRDRARWWSTENQARVVEAVARLASGVEPLEVWIVFDQRRAPGEAGSDESSGPVLHEGMEVHHAPDADDFIVARCGELLGRREVVVVSADRSLRDRAKAHGASGLSPWAFARYPARPSASGDAGTR